MKKNRNPKFYFYSNFQLAGWLNNLSKKLNGLNFTQVLYDNNQNRGAGKMQKN